MNIMETLEIIIELSGGTQKNVQEGKSKERKMSKEMWIQAYECITEQIMEEKEVDDKEARNILNKIIDEDGDSLVCDYWYR